MMMLLEEDQWGRTKVTISLVHLAPALQNSCVGCNWKDDYSLWGFETGFIEINWNTCFIALFDDYLSSIWGHHDTNLTVDNLSTWLLQVVHVSWPILASLGGEVTNSQVD